MNNLQINKLEEPKLVTITRDDISSGYIVVQSNHSIADFSFDHPQKFKQWKEESNSIISLACKSQAHLLQLYETFSSQTECSLFYEPDISEYTSMCLYADAPIRKQLKKLQLILKNKPKSHVVD